MGWIKKIKTPEDYKREIYKELDRTMNQINSALFKLQDELRWMETSAISYGVTITDVEGLRKALIYIQHYCKKRGCNDCPLYGVEGCEFKRGKLPGQLDVEDLFPRDSVYVHEMR